MTVAINAKVARKLGVRRFEVAEYLRDDRDAAAYLEAVLVEGDPQLLAAALGHVARARGMSTVARKTGISRESLYRALSVDGNPELKTLTKVLHAMGMRLGVHTAA